MNDILDIMNNILETNDYEDKPVEVPAGEYLVNVGNITSKVSQSGNEYISVVLTIQDGEYANKRIYDTIMFTPKTKISSLKKIMKLAKDASIEMTPCSEVKDIAEQVAGLIGNMYNVSYNPDTFTRVVYKEQL